MQTRRKIYFDHSATTPVAPEVLESMLPYFSRIYGNAASIHSFGQEAKVALEESRRQVARMLHAEPGEIVFTASGTEADNWAIKGAALFYEGRKKRLITTTAEHHAVLNTCQYLGKKGFEVTYLKVDEFGLVEPDDVLQNIKDDTFLMSVMHVNNEVGAINPIAEIGRICKERGVIFHTDAVQSFGKIPLNVQTMNIDMLTLSGHKIYGPKGIGALYIRQGLQIDKLLHGGKHERDRRAGTENVAGAVGLGKAVEICSQKMEPDLSHLRMLRQALFDKITSTIPDIKLNGHPQKCYPGILNISFPGVQGDSLLLSLDLDGIAVSNGAACTSGTVEPSHVLQAMGRSREEANSAIRFSFGRDNTMDEIDYTSDALQQIITRLRKIKRKK